MTFSTPSAQPTTNQMPSQLIATSLGNRPGRLVTVTIFTLLANITLTLGLSLLVFHIQVQDEYYRIDGVWGGITPMFVFGFAFLIAAVTIAATSSDNPYSQRYLPDSSGTIVGYPRGLFEKPAFLSLVVAFGTIGIALSTSAGFSRLIFPAFIDREMEIVTTRSSGREWTTSRRWEQRDDLLWLGIPVIIFFGIVFFIVAIIVISTSNRPKLIPYKYYRLQISGIQNPMMPGYANSSSVQSQEISENTDVDTEKRSDASQKQSTPSENNTSEGEL